jgi:glyoxylase-like metal-dependent hydrolase (beta-lactamase superfamily II)
MPPVIVEGYTLGVFASNSYLVASKEGDEAVLIDCGQDAEQVYPERVEALGLDLEAVLLTHGHLDHIWGAQALADAAEVPVYIHPSDRYMLDDPGAAIGRMGLGKFEIGVPADVRDLADGDTFRYGDLTIETRHTPGHTPGHCIFLTDGIVFSGDLIFAGSIGRTDFPGGSFEQLMESIRRVILPLDDGMRIVSGHGPETTVGIERRTNPFVLADGSPERQRLLGL